MSKCENCLCNPVCDHNKYGWENCNNYKDKSLFVELPVTLGQICYDSHTYRNEVEECRVSSLTQKADGSWKIRLTHNYSVFEIRADEIGKTIFLSKEEAERKLKEVGE